MEEEEEEEDLSYRFKQINNGQPKNEEKEKKKRLITKRH